MLERASFGRLVRAQVGAELSTRLRSVGTLVALAALLVLSFLWMPNPSSGTVSIAWRTPEGALQTGQYTAAFVGSSAAILASLYLTLIGFYLVAGSVRRDRERGIGAILAATPMTRASYLAAKLAASSVYLLAVAGVSLIGGLAVFLLWGEGPFSLVGFLSPYLVMVPPGLIFTAAVALLFDVTPGLSGRGGQVLFFFAWAFGFLLVPAAIWGELGSTSAVPTGVPLYDPVGVVSIERFLRTALPQGFGGELNIGLLVTDEPLSRVDWQAVPLDGEILLSRLVSLLWLLPVFGLAVLAFDRFDPARRSLRRQKKAPALPEPAPGAVAAAPTAARSFKSLPRVTTRPGWARALAAETLLLRAESPRLFWPVAAAAFAAAIPGAAGRVPSAIFLLLLAPLIAEAASRERSAGAEALVFSQPSVPRSRALWKAASVAVFVLVLGLPGLIGAALGSPASALGWLLGLSFVATAAVGLGSLSRGGKLFLGLYTALWYLALNAAPFADFVGRLGPEPSLATPAAFALLGLGLVALAALVEGRQRVRG
ncbi:MAG TPA: hypothetical protein VF017_00805 [Thermoanaerobaculia bacterium]|nr:hypothetical protein [Thermoanaerobaculia bacterium]